jgi:hypothetical protein
VGPAALREGTVVDDGRRQARQKDEDLCRIGKADIPVGESRQAVPGNVVDEDHPQRQPAHRVDPQVASGDRRRCGKQGGPFEAAGAERLCFGP